MRKLGEFFIALLERFIGKRFAANVAKLMSGTLVAMAINFVVTPILTRLYTPATFGVFGTITALVGTLSGIAALRFGMAIVIPDDDEDAVNLLVLGLSCIAGTSVLTTIVFVGFGDFVAAQYDTLPGLADWLWAVPVLIAITSVFQICRYWFTRTQRFGAMSIAAVTASVISSGSKLGAGFSALAIAGLLYSQMLGQLVATGGLALLTYTKTRKMREAVSVKRMRTMAGKYRDFPKFNVPVTLINASAKNMPIFGLGWFFSADVVGWYSMAYLVLNLPVYVVSDALRQVFYQKANETFKSGGNLFAEIARLTLMLLGVGLLPAGIFATFAPSLLQAFLGSQWLPAGEFARLLTPYLLTLLVVSPAATVLPVLNLQRAQLVWQVLSIGGTTTALFVGGQIDDPNWAVGLFSVSGSLLNLFLIAYVLFRIRKPEKLKTGY